MLAFALLLVALLFSTAKAQADGTYTQCVAQGYNLTSITNHDLFYTGGGYSWAIRPCGYVTTAGYCDPNRPGEFCQSTTTVSSMNWTGILGAGVGNGPQYAQVKTGSQYGVAQLLQDGDSCGSYDREGTIEYLCNSTATTPYISSITELLPFVCHYQALVQTAAVCSQVPATGFSTTPGTAIVSQACGAQIYDLTNINSIDITGSVGTYNWSLRLCGTVTSTALCSNVTNGGANNVSICQVQGNTGYYLATYAPSVAPVVWVYNAPGSISQIIQDGAGCAGQNRLTNITLNCNDSATTPYLASVVENPICHYSFNIQTNQVCGQAFATLPGGASSSSGVAGGASSSAGSSSSGAVVAASSSPAAVSSSAAVGSSSAAPSVSSSAAPVVSSSGATVSPSSPVSARSSSSSAVAPSVSSSSAAPLASSSSGVVPTVSSSAVATSAVVSPSSSTGTPPSSVNASASRLSVMGTVMAVVAAGMALLL